MVSRRAFATLVICSLLAHGREAALGDADRIAREDGEYHATVADAERFVSRLCDQLGLPADCAIRPMKISPMSSCRARPPVKPALPKAEFDDPPSRDRLVRQLDGGLMQPAAYVLPLHAWQSEGWARNGWQTGGESGAKSFFCCPGIRPPAFACHCHHCELDPDSSVPTSCHAIHSPPLHLAIQRRALSSRRTATRESRRPMADKDATGTCPFAQLSWSSRVMARSCVFMPPLTDAEDIHRSDRGSRNHGS